MMRWLIVVLATVVLAVVGTVAIACQPEDASCPTYMAHTDRTISPSA